MYFSFSLLWICIVGAWNRSSKKKGEGNVEGLSTLGVNTGLGGVSEWRPWYRRRVLGALGERQWWWEMVSKERNEWGSNLVYFKLCSGTVSVRNLSVANKWKLSTDWLRQKYRIIDSCKQKARSRFQKFMISSGLLLSFPVILLTVRVLLSLESVMVAAMATVVQNLPFTYCPVYRKR